MPAPFFQHAGDSEKLCATCVQIHTSFPGSLLHAWDFIISRRSGHLQTTLNQTIILLLNIIDTERSDTNRTAQHAKEHYKDTSGGTTRIRPKQKASTSRRRSLVGTIDNRRTCRNRNARRSAATPEHSRTVKHAVAGTIRHKPERTV